MANYTAHKQRDTGKLSMYEEEELRDAHIAEAKQIESQEAEAESHQEKLDIVNTPQPRPFEPSYDKTQALLNDDKKYSFYDGLIWETSTSTPSAFIQKWKCLRCFHIKFKTRRFKALAW